MGMPLVSIIMGLYNNEKTIDECVNSIINQTYPNWELIICNDCSTDGSYKKAQEIAQRDKRIKLLENEKNSKLAATLNHCLEHAKGQYIARMDADDTCKPNRSEKQVNFLNEHAEFDVVGSAADVSDGNVVFEKRITKEVPEKMDLIKGTPYIHPSIMMRKEAYDKLHGYTVANRTIRGQDLDLWFRFYANGMKGYNLQESLITYYEKKEDYKKRNFKTAKMYVRTNLFGFRLLQIPLKYYLYAFKPFLSYLLPNQLLRKYHQHKKLPDRK